MDMYAAPGLASSWQVLSQLVDSSRLSVWLYVHKPPSTPDTGLIL